MPQESLKKLYDAGSQHYDLGDLPTFMAKMRNADSRKKFYDSLSQHYDLGGYDVFNSKVDAGLAEGQPPITGKPGRIASVEDLLAGKNLPEVVEADKHNIPPSPEIASRLPQVATPSAKPEVDLAKLLSIAPGLAKFLPSPLTTPVASGLGKLGELMQKPAPTDDEISKLGFLEKAGRSALGSTVGMAGQTSSYLLDKLGQEGAGQYAREQTEKALAATRTKTTAQANKKFDISDLGTADFWATDAAATVPPLLALLPLGMAGATLSAPAAAALVAKAGITGGLASTLTGALSSIGGALASRPVESLMEASSTYEDLIKQGAPKEKAAEAAAQTFRANLSLVGLDAAQLASIMFGNKAPKGVVSGFSKFANKALTAGKIGAGALSEGLEEKFQSWVSDVTKDFALGKTKEYDFSPQEFYNYINKAPIWQQEDFVLGTLMGLGAEGVGVLREMGQSEDEIRETIKRNPQAAVNAAQQATANAASGKPIMPAKQSVEAPPVTTTPSSDVSQKETVAQAVYGQPFANLTLPQKNLISKKIAEAAAKDEDARVSAAVKNLFAPQEEKKAEKVVSPTKKQPEPALETTAAPREVIPAVTAANKTEKTAHPSTPATKPESDTSPAQQATPAEVAPKVEAKTKPAAQAPTPPIERVYQPVPAPEQAKPEIASPASSSEATRDEKQVATEVKYVPLSQLHVDPDRFQNRATPFSEKTAATIAERFDPNKLDALTVWHDPKDNKDYVISGHSRFEGLGRRKEPGAPIRYFQGDEQAAINFAKLEANRLGTPESLSESIKAYRTAKSQNLSRAKLKDLFDGDLDFLDAAQNLDQKGDFINILSQSARDEFPHIKRFSRYVGELRGKYADKLTDRHEQQIFDWLYKGEKKNVDTGKDAFFNKVETQVERSDFSPDQPLVLKRGEVAQTGTRGRADTASLERELDQLREDRKRARTVAETEVIDKDIARIQKGLAEIVKTQPDLFSAVEENPAAATQAKTEPVATSAPVKPESPKSSQAEKKSWQMTADEARVFMRDIHSAAERYAAENFAAAQVDDKDLASQYRLENGKLAKIQSEYDRKQLPPQELIDRLNSQKEKVYDIKTRLDTNQSTERSNVHNRAKLEAEYLTTNYPSLYNPKKDYPYAIATEQQDEYSLGHKAAVKRAIRRGDAVPNDVLASYPDFQPTAKNYDRAVEIFNRVIDRSINKPTEAQQEAVREELEAAGVHPIIIQELTEPKRSPRPGEADFPEEIGIGDAYDFLRKVESQQYATTRKGRIESAIDPPTELKAKVDAIADAGKAMVDAEASLEQAKKDIIGEIESRGGEVVVNTDTGAFTIKLNTGKAKMGLQDILALKKLRQEAAEAGAYSLATVGRGFEIAVTPEKVAEAKPLAGTFAEKAKEFIRRNQAEKEAGKALDAAKENARNELVDHYLAERAAEREPRAFKGTASDGTAAQVLIRRNRSAVEPDIAAGGRDFPAEIQSFKEDAATRAERGKPFISTRETGKKTFAEALKAGRVVDTASRAFGANNTIVTREQLDDAFASLAKKVKLNTGIDPSTLPELLKIGTFYVEGGIREFGAWSDKMVASLTERVNAAFAERVKPQLMIVWDEIKKRRPGLFKAAKATTAPDLFSAPEPVAPAKPVVEKAVESQATAKPAGVEAKAKNESVESEPPKNILQAAAQKAAQKKPTKNIFVKEPPGGFTEADRVPEKYRKQAADSNALESKAKTALREIENDERQIDFNRENLEERFGKDVVDYLQDNKYIVYQQNNYSLSGVTAKGRGFANIVLEEKPAQSPNILQQAAKAATESNKLLSDIVATKFGGTLPDGRKLVAKNIATRNGAQQGYVKDNANREIVEYKEANGAQRFAVVEKAAAKAEAPTQEQRAWADTPYKQALLNALGGNIDLAKEAVQGIGEKLPDNWSGTIQKQRAAKQAIAEYVMRDEDVERVFKALQDAEGKAEEGSVRFKQGDIVANNAAPKERLIVIKDDGENGVTVEDDLGFREKVSRSQLQPFSRDAALLREYKQLNEEGNKTGFTPEITRRMNELREEVNREPDTESQATQSKEGATANFRSLANLIKLRLERNAKLDNPALTALAEEAFGGTRAQGTYSAKDAYDALELAVNEYIAERPEIYGGNLNPRAVLESLRTLMNKLPRQTDRTLEQDQFQQFSTPPTQAFVAAKILNPQQGEVVLEPSAGVGGLAVFPKLAGANVHTNEISPRRADLLKMQGYPVTKVDAEIINDVLPDNIRPTAILMNPPFSATGGRVLQNKTSYGAKHVESALQRLENNGRLVAIVGQGMALDKPTFTSWWQRIAQKYNVRANIGIPGDEYSKYGTTFDNQIIVIDKTGATPGNNWAEQTNNIVKGDVENLEEALNVTAKITADRKAVAQPVRPETGERPLAERAGSVRTGVGEQSPEVGRRERVVESGKRPGRDTGGIGESGSQTGAKTLRASEPRNKSEQAADESGRTARTANLSDRRGRAEDVGESSGERAATESIGIPGESSGLESGATGVIRESEASGKFVRYKPAKLRGGVEHPANIVESSSMAAVDPPDIKYQASLPSSIIKEGKLSGLQLETVHYAGQQFDKIMPNGQRMAFFLGDGTGVGKGRQISGVVGDQWNKGVKKILWVSASRDLMEDATRDVNDLGLDIPINSINDYSPSGNIDAPSGIIFSTYQSLIAESRGETRQTRQAQLEKWLGNNSLIIFDEAHKAKNALAVGSMGEPSQTAQAVIGIQNNLPKARVLYSSATGATDVRNMAYMTRLGLWGPGTAFPDGFMQFLQEIDSGGVGAMEMVSRDMKALGMYASRSISFEGVDYRETIHELTPEQRNIYNVAAQAWQTVLQNIDEALGITNASAMARARALSRFWGDHQRFFKQVVTALKVPTAIKEVDQALKDGKSVVLSVIGTGESRTKELIARSASEGKSLEELDFSPREVIANLVDHSFPTDVYQDQTDPDTGKTIKVLVKDAGGNPVQSREAIALKERLLDQLSDLNLPENPLDQVVNYYGAEKVAEMTGRKRRLIRNPKTGKTEYVTRAPDGVAMNKTNLYEMKAFQDGRKNVAIISDAAATGISLHASNRAKNKQRRVHITLELGWSADKQMQTFGRTHRSDQASAPEYVLLSTDVGGEKRFSSTIARRLASLGALTKGQRDATGGGDLAKYNFETQEGAAAVSQLYSQAMGEEKELGIENPRQALRDMGVLKPGKDGSEDIKPDDRTDVTKFLNRVLALDIDRQNKLFDGFIKNFEGIVQSAKDNGTFDDGVADIKGESIRLVGKPEIVHRDKATGAETLHYHVEVDVKTEPLDFDEAGKILKNYKASSGAGFYTNDRSGNVFLATPSGSQTNQATGRVENKFRLIDPKNNYRWITEAELADKFTASNAQDAKTVWDEKIASIPKIETDEKHIIGGAILPLWQKLKTQNVSKLKVVRVTTDSGKRIVGIVIPDESLGSVLRSIGVSRSLRGAPEIFKAVFEQGDSVELAGGLTLTKSRIHGDDAIELAGVDYSRQNEMRNLGLLNERIDWKQRFFIPTDERKGIKILTDLIERYPAVSGEGEKSTSSRESELLDDAADESSKAEIEAADATVNKIEKCRS